VTSIFPYVLLTIMLIRGVTLEGAALGIEFYLIPDWSKLADPKVIPFIYSFTSSGQSFILLTNYMLSYLLDHLLI